MPRENEADGAAYIGPLIFAMIVHMFGGYAELAMTIERLPVFYKHRDLLFYPSWVFTLPYFLLRIPFSILESAAWVIITYYIIGFNPAASRFFKQFLLILLILQMEAGLFRAIAGISMSVVIANSGGSIVVVLTFVLGGFILSRDLILKGWIWGYGISPLIYAYNALAVNDFSDP